MKRKKRRNFRILDKESILNPILSSEKEKKKKRIKMISLFAIIFVIVLGTYFLNMYYSFDDYKVKKTLDVESGTNSRYAAFGDFVVKYSNDGISYINGKETVWNEAYEMKSPVIDICESYLAIADKNSNTIYVYNEKGKQGEITTSYPIIKLEVAKQGVVAALLEDKNANYIEVYDKEGKVLISHKTLLEDNGFPISFSVSNDGKKMIVSYIAVQNGKTKNKVMFYNFSNVGKDKVDRVVGTFDHYEETIVPAVSFLSNDNAIAIGDNILSIYKMNEKPSLKKEVLFEDVIQKVFYNEDYIGFVFTNDNDECPYRIEVYNLSGRKVMESDIEMNFDVATFAGKNVLMYSDMNCQIISLKGITKFKYTFTEEINGIVPMSEKYTYLLMTNSKIEKIRLK